MEENMVNVNETEELAELETEEVAETGDSGVDVTTIAAIAGAAFVAGLVIKPASKLAKRGVMAAVGAWKNRKRKPVKEEAPEIIEVENEADASEEENPEK